MSNFFKDAQFSGVTQDGKVQYKKAGMLWIADDRRERNGPKVHVISMEEAASLGFTIKNGSKL